MLAPHDHGRDRGYRAGAGKYRQAGAPVNGALKIGLGAGPVSINATPPVACGTKT